LKIVSGARRSAVKARTQAIKQLRALLVSAPDDIRDMALKVKSEQCVAACAGLPKCDENPAMARLATTLRLLAKRWMALDKQVRELDTQLARLAKQAAPRLLARFRVRPQTAATLLVTAGDNPTRLRNEAAMAALCGVSPLSASSGKVCRHRLNRSGERQANNALWTMDYGLWTIAMVRMRSDTRTREYVAWRTGEGLSKKEINRCLKRYIVRELYPLIVADLHDWTHTT
jgi:transposase